MWRQHPPSLYTNGELSITPTVSQWIFGARDEGTDRVGSIHDDFQMFAPPECRDSQNVPQERISECEQSVDFPIPQDVSKFSKCQVSSSIVLAVFMTRDAERSGSIHDEDQSDAVHISWTVLACLSLTSCWHRVNPSPQKKVRIKKLHKSKDWVRRLSAWKTGTMEAATSTVVTFFWRRGCTGKFAANMMPNTLIPTRVELKGWGLEEHPWNWDHDGWSQEPGLWN